MGKYIGKGNVEWAHLWFVNCEFKVKPVSNVVSLWCKGYIPDTFSGTHADRI